MKLFICFFTVVFTVISFHPAQAQSPVQGGDPASSSEPVAGPDNTLIAPFAAEGRDKKTAANPLGDLYLGPGSLGSTNRLDRPHRHKNDISRWLEQTMSDVFSVDVRTYNEHEMELSKLLNESALIQYQEFFSKNNIIKVLAHNKMLLNSYVKSAPLLLNEGSVSNRYRCASSISALPDTAYPSIEETIDVGCSGRRLTSITNRE